MANLIIPVIPGMYTTWETGGEGEINDRAELICVQSVSQRPGLSLSEREELGKGKIPVCVPANIAHMHVYLM